jgi:hypothetical protein
MLEEVSFTALVGNGASSVPIRTSLLSSPLDDYSLYFDKSSTNFAEENKY